ncbi:methylated-DNA--[protein]-cysteine S-methyltransferase [Dehalococcoidia bacterium]|nr:methylated-DNA--[protein]-cysteine S-methyltransferase [Dehalococcoidia bacterium]
MAKATYFDIFETSQGWIGILASDRGLRKTTLPQESPDLCYSLLGREVEAAANKPERFKAIQGRLVQYFAGAHASFEDLPLDLEGAPKFTCAVWRACQSIPHGETRSYSWLANQVGSPRAPRAVGQSMARNRLPIIVPCHRVIGNDGSLTGFGKGSDQLELKKRLLDGEAS